MLKGLAAGLAATVVMTQFQNLWNQLTPEGEPATNEASPDQQQEHGGAGQGGRQGAEQQQSEGESDAAQAEPATVQAAAISENVFGHELTQQEKQIAGPAMHYGFGASMGALYGVTAELVPEVAAGAGLGFGALLFLGAVRRGNHEMAAANILGTNCLEMALFFVADVCYSEGPILAATDRSAIFAATLGMIVTSVFLLGLLERRDRTVFGMGVDSLLVLIVYLVGLVALYYLR